MKNTKTILIILAGVFSVGAIAAFTGSPLSIADGDDCIWIDVELEGQTFSSMNELEDFVENSQEYDMDDMRGDIQFRTHDGTLQQGNSECGLL